MKFYKINHGLWVFEGGHIIRKDGLWIAKWRSFENPVSRAFRTLYAAKLCVKERVSDIDSPKDNAEAFSAHPRETLKRLAFRYRAKGKDVSASYCEDLHLAIENS